MPVNFIQTPVPVFLAPPFDRCVPVNFDFEKLHRLAELWRVNAMPGFLVGF
jgi:hypothetical protein